VGLAVDRTLEPDLHLGEVMTMAKSRADLDALEAAIGHCFANRALLLHALTHASAAPTIPGRSGSYQRMEFLGDRVLGLAIADMLFNAFPAAEEGELSRRLAELVRKESCADVADAWHLAHHLKLGPGESTLVRRNRTILADVCEAVVGAVFLDGGYGAARAVVERAFGEAMHMPRRPLRDAKTALQEWAQARGLAAPTYALIERQGPDHAPEFRIAVNVEGLESAQGVGATKRLAEQAAAASLLVRESIWNNS
jgi:ribonuclease-3